MKKIKKIAIANRGEVACRIHKTCEKLGIKTVLLHSEPDVETLAYRMCDETFCIGPAQASKSYLNIDQQIDAALECKVDAVHPGFGFLSESSEFAQRVEDAGLIFIGPSAKNIASFGDKKTAKTLCQKAEVPLIPGYQGDDSDIGVLIKECEKIGYPVMVKATAGGGGRGMRILYDSKSAKEQIQNAKDEALKAFGNESVFLEKYMNSSKHIEVQIFGDCNNNIYVLGERECSVQRKHQKIIEETPSTSINDEQRKYLHQYARKIAEVATYQNAGTVEFLFQDNKFYFLEVNTRLQVEHPVTEEVYDIDLVEAQILTADQQSLSWSQSLQPKGHAMELRFYAENPYKNGAPSVGLIGRTHFPKATGRRFEYGIERGDRVSPYYDSMIAKIISYKKDRKTTISDLIDCLQDLKIFGVYTNKPLLLSILNHPEFIQNSVTTQFFENNFSASLQPQINEKSHQKYENIISKLLDIKTPLQEKKSPWAQAWQNTFESSEREAFEVLSQKIDYEFIESTLWWTLSTDTFSLNIKRQKAQSKAGEGGSILSPMPGTLFKVLCSPGDEVKEGDTLLVLEAMKMEHSIKSPQDGKVKAIHFEQGASVQAEDLILDLE